MSWSRLTPEWFQSYEVEDEPRSSRSFAVTSGTRTEVDGLDLADVSGDGTAATSAFAIPSGSEYTLTSYAPNPTPRQLRRPTDRPRRALSTTRP